MPNMDMTEAIIEAMKQYPMLYNTDHTEYRNLRKKAIAWVQLGAQFGEEGDTMKRKWKNIRDSYAKYLRSLEMDPGSYAAGAKYAKFWSKWRFASNMEPFKPFLGKSENRDREQYSLGEANLETGLMQTEAGVTPSGFVQVYEELKDENIVEATTFHPKKRKHEPTKKQQKEYDALEHLFLYYAKTMKGFLPRRQIQTKMRIAQIMMEEEIADQNEKQRLHAEREMAEAQKH